MDPARLPGDLFVKLLEINLSPRQIIQLRAVSTTWNTILRAPDVCRRFLRVFYPQSREIRLDMLRHSIGELPSVPHNLRVEVECRHQQNKDWGVIFLEVARRYHNLRHGTPQEYVKVAMPPLLDQTHINDCPTGGRDHGYFKNGPFSPESEDRICDVCKYKRCWWGGGLYWENFPTRNRYLYHKQRTEFDRPDPLWWYSQEDGLLVYPAACNVPLRWDVLDPKATFHAENMPLPHPWADNAADNARFIYQLLEADHARFIYQLLDPQTGQHFQVPFDAKKKVVRRVRLSHGVLVIEWAEFGKFELWDRPLTGKHFVPLTGSKHFVTAFDVIRTPVTPDGSVPYDGSVGDGPDDWKPPRQHYYTWNWKVKLRAEWEMLGQEPELLPQDKGCPFKTRCCFSAHTDTHYAVYTLHDEVRSQYRGGYTANLRVWDISTTPPVLVRHMPNHHITRLDNRGQRNAPNWRELDIRTIALDKHNVYLIREYHCHLIGSDTIHARWQGESVRTGHTVETRGIPVIPFPSGSIPHPDPVIPDPDQRIGSPPHPYLNGIPSDTKNPVYGPTWFDECPRTYTPRYSTRRVETIHCRHTHTTVPTEEAEPTFSPERGSSLWPVRLPPTLLPSLRQLPFPWNQSDAASNPLQPTTFPGNAPCWRHDLCPYLTVSSVIDYAAGVRFVARDGYHWPRDIITVDISGSDSYDCHYRPELSDEDEDGDEEGSFDSLFMGELTLQPRELPEGEVEIGVDGLWGNMMGRMTLAGDERFVIGQDSACRITLLRF